MREREKTEINNAGFRTMHHDLAEQFGSTIAWAMVLTLYAQSIHTVKYMGKKYADYQRSIHSYLYTH